MKRIILAGVLVLAIPSRVMGSDDPTAKAQAAIEKATAAFEAAFEAGKPEALAMMYTEDAIVFPPAAEMVKGREAIAALWKETMGSGVKKVDLVTLDVGVSGDLAHETGTVVLSITPEGKGSITVSAKYLVVWKRQADGSWKIHRDIWNDLPAKK